LQGKWHDALAGWICAGICLVIALMLLIWVRLGPQRAMRPCSRFELTVHSDGRLLSSGVVTSAAVLLLRLRMLLRFVPPARKRRPQQHSKRLQNTSRPCAIWQCAGPVRARHTPRCHLSQLCSRRTVRCSLRLRAAHFRSADVDPSRQSGVLCNRKHACTSSKAVIEDVSGCRRSRPRRRHRCCGVLPLLCIAMLVVTVALATWALVEGVNGIHHKVDDFWAIEQSIRDQARARGRIAASRSSPSFCRNLSYPHPRV